MTAKVAVGAHYGLRDWLSQRITAVVITLYTALLDKESDNGALATIVHEMGHALGLVHRMQPGTVMNATTDDHTDPTPDETDYANLRAIYG